MSVKIENIIVGFTCPECEHEATQSLADMGTVGGLICSECDTDMDMDSTADVVPDVNASRTGSGALWIEVTDEDDEDSSAHWGNVSDEQIDQITDYAARVLGAPDTVA